MPDSFTGSLTSLQAQRRSLPPVCASVHRSPVPLDSLQDRHKTWNPSGKPLPPSQRYTPRAPASGPDSFSRCAEPPPRPPDRSSRTAGCRGRSPAPPVQRAGGLRCSRLHPGACPRSPRLPPVRSRLPHKSQLTRIAYLASASPSPRTCRAVRPSRASTGKLASDTGRRGFDTMRPPRAATMIALAPATGHARTWPASRTGAGEMMPCSMHFLMLPVLPGSAVRLRPRHAATSQAGRSAQNRLMRESPR